MRLLAFLLCLAAFPVHAQKPVYAVASMVGDRILVVSANSGVGSNLDRNRREFFELKSPALDNGVVIAVDEALHQRDPEAKSILLGVSTRAMQEMQARSLDEGGTAKPLIDAIRPVARNAGASHLILVLKHRDDARLRTFQGFVGGGKLEGLGYYVDSMMKMENRESGEATQGFVAPFAYFRIALVDLASGAIVNEQVVRESQAVASQQAVVPWDALTPESKVRLLQQIVRRAVLEAVPDLLEKR